MKLLFLRLFMLMILVSSFTACGSGPNASDASGTQKTRIPWPQADGTYALQVIELTGLANLYELSGQFVTYFMSPSIADGHLAGPHPKARFVKAGDLYLPADELTMQLATVYGHMEKLAALDDQVGATGINHWPRDIGVSVRLGGGVRNNAFYDGDTDSMLFVPYNGKDLPISVNAGILAHEHFHSLFYKIVTVPLKASGKDPGRVSITAHSQEEVYKLFQLPTEKLAAEDLGADKQQTAYHILLLRGLNEGLADFWGWMYTGNPDFIADSLPSERRARSLKVDESRVQLRLSSSFAIRDTVSTLSTDEKNLSQNLNSNAYALGTQYSRIFKAFADRYATNRQLDGLEARKQVATIIIKTLPLLKTDMLNLKDTDYYEPTAFLESFLKQIDGPRQSECDLIASVLNDSSLSADTNASCVQKDGGDVWNLQKITPPEATTSVAAPKKAVAR